MTTAEEAPRQQLFRNLHSALWPSANGKAFTHGTFAASETIKPSQGFSLKSLDVEGAGELQLPLSTKDASKLRDICKRRAFRTGAEDRTARRCWQVDASKVSFPGTPTFLSDIIQTLAVESVGALGLDGAEMELETHLDKLLLYEAGGHFTFHVDTEKGKGVFAMLILQLPTEQGYEGGEVVVKSDDKVETLDCHMVSALGFCYTVFFANCPHKQAKIISGTKLCLAFSLVNHDFSLDRAQREFMHRQVRKAEVALKPWLEEVTTRKLNHFGRKLVIPLQHEYTWSTLSFTGLQGNDIVVAEVLKDCTGRNKERWLDLHLCFATKVEFAILSPCTHCDHDCLDPDHHLMDIASARAKNLKFEATLQNMIGWNDRISKSFKKLCIDNEKEILYDGEDPFDSEPLSREANIASLRVLGDMYYRAVLVAWPKALSISIACEGSVSEALNLLDKTSKKSGPAFVEQVHQVVCYCEENPTQVWGKLEDLCEDSVTPRLLRLCSRENMLEVLLQIFQLLSKVLGELPRSCPDKKDSGSMIGVRNAEVARAIAAAVQAHGWDLVALPIIDLARACTFTQGNSFAQLAGELMRLGNIDAGALVAKTMFEVFETRIATLESVETPNFIGCQPHAKLPEYPDVEKFLKGPLENYVQRDFKTLREANLFAKKYFSKARQDASTGYLATATVGGHGRNAFCEIQKTGGVVLKVAMEEWRERQKQIQNLRREMETLRSTVFEASLASTTRVSHNSGQPASKSHNSGQLASKSHNSGQPASKRQRVETGVSEGKLKRPEGGTAECIDLTLDE